jgi:peptidoglycan/xylan/chitin deacetylase (PgdA/CDA1 family)
MNESLSFATNYATVKHFQHYTAKNKLRDMAMNLAAPISSLFGIDKILTKKNRVQFLFLHHLFDDEINQFRKLLNTLSKEHTFINYSEAVSRIKTGNIDKPYICFSSDDGYKSNITLAKVFSEFNISACFFLCPSVIAETNLEVIKKYANNNLRFEVPIEFMNWNEVEAIQKLDHEIGSHTHTHIDVSQQSFEKIAEEFSVSKNEIEKHCGVIKHLALPFGRFSPFKIEWWEVATDTGFESCASAVNGCHVASTQPIKTEELFIRRNLILPNQWTLRHQLFYLQYNSFMARPSNNFLPQTF